MTHESRGDSMLKLAGEWRSVVRVVSAWGVPVASVSVRVGLVRGVFG